MALLSKKINMDFIDGIASIATLHWVKIFKLCNKYQTFLARHLGLVTKKVPEKDIASRLDGIWQHGNLLHFMKLVCENPEWFWKQVQKIISVIKKLE